LDIVQTLAICRFSLFNDRGGTPLFILQRSSDFVSDHRAADGTTKYPGSFVAPVRLSSPSA